MDDNENPTLIMNSIKPIGFNRINIYAAWMAGTIDDLEFTKLFIEGSKKSEDSLRKLEAYNAVLYDIAPSGNLYEMTKRDETSFTKILVSLEEICKHDFALVYGLSVNNFSDFYLYAFPDLWKKLGMKEFDISEKTVKRLDKRIEKLRDLYRQELVEFAIQNEDLFRIDYPGSSSFHNYLKRMGEKKV